MKIYHNPHCSKSNVALNLIKEDGIEPQIVHYLQKSPTRDELIEVLKLLKISPYELIRKQEPIFLEKYQGKDWSNDQWLDVLMEHPILIQRPIVVQQDRAIIARSKEEFAHWLKP